MIKIPTAIRTLAAASALALAVAAFATGSADAKPKRPTDNGVRCAISGNLVNESEDTVFYMPYEYITVQDAQGKYHDLVCGADGRWHETRLSGIRAVPSVPTAQPVTPRR